MRPDRLWFSLLIAGTALEAWALRGKRRDATLSHLTRRTFATHTVPGRVAFVGAWTWFLLHILKEQPRE